MNRKASAAIVIIAAIVCGQAASASVIEYTDKSEWEGAVGSYTTLDFVLPPTGTPLNSQYRSYGALLEGFLWSHNSTSAYPNDDWGLRSAPGGGGAWVHFDTPQNWIAVEYPGSIRIELFCEGQSVFLSTNFETSGAGNFAGLHSQLEFDTVHLHRMVLQEFDSIFIDDLHFGTLIPGPGALGLLALAGLITPRRRRREAHAGCAPHTGDGSC